MGTEKDLSNSKFISLVAYPNPSSQFFIVDIKGDDNAKTELFVYDVLGRIVKQISIKSNEEIRFGDELPSGSYLAIIRRGDQQKTIKLLKQ